MHDCTINIWGGFTRGESCLYRKLTQATFTHKNLSLLISCQPILCQVQDPSENLNEHSSRGRQIKIAHYHTCSTLTINIHVYFPL